jgi:prepilin-type N-terminal cleavage/methylation domain-containing protein
VVVPGGDHDGFSLVEIIIVTALFATIVAIALPQLETTIDRGRAIAAAKYLAGQCAVARMQAVMRSATVAIRFDEAHTGYRFALYLDRDRDGVQTHDIASGIDRRIGDFDRLSDKFPGVTLTLGAPDVNADRGTSHIVSFTPVGTATSITMFVRGREGSRFAVRVLGATARTRVLRYDDRRDQWIDF